jgi:hypothetical protein
MFSSGKIFERISKIACFFLDYNYLTCSSLTLYFLACRLGLSSHRTLGTNVGCPPEKKNSAVAGVFYY